MLADVHDDSLRTLAADYSEQAVSICGDLRSRSYCGDIVAKAIESFGALDIVLNNAGVIPRGSAEETSDEMWMQAMEVNLYAPFFIARAAIPHLKERGGAIVNTSSVWGVYPGPAHVAYNTSKGALATLTKNLGRDCAPFGIRVNAVCPHEINTPMIRSGFIRRGIDPDNAIAELNQSVPLGRIAEPEDIADVIAFLASDEARYIAGECVEVTGAKAVA